jgi:hypothetical protein
MAITTYAELQTAVANWLNRDDLTAVVPDFISLAEAQIARDVRHWQMMEQAALTVAAQYEDLPASWLETIRLTITSGTQRALETAGLNEIMAQRQRADSPSTPNLYAHVGGKLEFYPTPDTAYSMELTYYARVPALSDSNTTSWLLTEAPDVYLYGALVHAAPYLKDDARIQIWEAFHAQAIDNLNTSSSDAKYGGSGLVMRSRRGAF